MTRTLAIILGVLVILGGAAFALRERIGCFLYLRASHQDQIAFLRGDGVYLMGSAGSSPCRILDDKAYVAVAWSPDGEQLALLNLDGDIYTVQPDGSAFRQIVSGTAIEDRLVPAWSPDGTQIAFVRSSDTRNRGIYVAEVASGSERQVTQELPALFPVWSPAGDRIAFVTEDNGLYVVEADGNGLRQLSDGARFDNPPTWSPDGTQIAFMNIDFEISRVNLDGSDEQVISNLRNDVDGAAFYVTWSPIENQIAAEVMVRDPKLRISLFLLDPETHKTRKLTSEDKYSTFVTWTPDGNYLLYTNPDGDDELFRVNVADGMIEPLAQGSEAAARPN